MTEYDYSPAAQQAYQDKLRSIANWAYRAPAQHHQHSNPFVPSESGESDFFASQKKSRKNKNSSSGRRGRRRERRGYDSDGDDDSDSDYSGPDRPPTPPASAPVYGGFGPPPQPAFYVSPYGAAVSPQGYGGGYYQQPTTAPASNMYVPMWVGGRMVYQPLPQQQTQQPASASLVPSTTYPDYETRPRRHRFRSRSRPRAHNRRSTFPELYQLAGSRNHAKMKLMRVAAQAEAQTAIPMSMSGNSTGTGTRDATHDQPGTTSTGGPVRSQRRSHTYQGLLRGGTKSVPQSTWCTEDEDRLGGEDESQMFYSVAPCSQLDSKGDEYRLRENVMEGLRGEFQNVAIGEGEQLLAGGREATLLPSLPDAPDYHGPLRGRYQYASPPHDNNEAYSLQHQDEEYHPQDYGYHDRQSPSVSRPAVAPNREHGGYLGSDDEYGDFEPTGSQQQQKKQQKARPSMDDQWYTGSPSDYPSATCQSAALGARGALEHINTRRNDIQKPFGTLQTAPILFAGFNEAHIREGAGLLQEIHILALEDADFDESALAEVGKVCSPFPSMIFTPSGKCFQPPLYDQNGMAVSFSTLSGSVCKLRYDLAADRALNLPETGRVVDHNGGTPRRATSSHRPTSENRSPTPRRSGNVIQSPVAGSQSSSCDQSASIEEGEGRTTHASNSTESGNARERLSREPEDALPEDPPGHGGSSVKHLRRIHLALLVGIRQALPTDSSRQEMQLQADFGYQLDPGASATVQFTRLRCSEETEGSKNYQAHYLNQHLSVVVDAQSPKWRSCHCSPKRTPAAQREIKDVTTTKSSKQGGTKLKVALAPSGSLEGSFAVENSKASERVRLTSGIMQKERLGVNTWGFDVDDEKEQLDGLELSDDKLPNLSLAYLPDARQLSGDGIPEELTVEISAFWSLALQQPNTWLSISNLISLGQRLPEYSNFVHSARVDLPADMGHDGHFVGKQDIVNGGGIPERREIITKSQGILVSSGIQLIRDRHPEGVPRWLPKQKMEG